jgi:hypothetical protein
MRNWSLAGTATLLLFAHSLGAQSLSEPVSQVVIGQSFASKPVPKWENGLLVGYDSDELPARVYAYDRAGRLVTQASITVPDAARLRLFGIAASLKGVLAVSGSAYSAEGAAAAFIAWISPSGVVQRVMRTSPFAAIQLCFSADEVLWVAGREVTPDFKDEAPHDVLRRYDGEGRLLQSLLARASFHSYDSHHPAVRAYLVAADTVGFYSASAKEWIEVSLSGTVLGRWKGIDLVPSLKVSGVGLTSDGTVYLSGVLQNTSEATEKTEYYRLDKTQGVWQSVGGPRGVGTKWRFNAIAGADKGTLVLRTGSNLFWVPVL